jgi:hypothetical protein
VNALYVRLVRKQSDVRGFSARNVTVPEGTDQAVGFLIAFPP